MVKICKFIAALAVLIACSYGVDLYTSTVKIAGYRVKLSKLKGAWEGIGIVEREVGSSPHNNSTRHTTYREVLSSNPGAKHVVLHGFITETDEENDVPFSPRNCFIELYTLKGKLVYHKDIGQKTIWRPQIFSNGNILFRATEPSGYRKCSTSYYFYDSQGNQLSAVLDNAEDCDTSEPRKLYPNLRWPSISASAEYGLFIKNISRNRFQLLKALPTGEVAPFTPILEGAPSASFFEKTNNIVAYSERKTINKKTGDYTHYYKTIYFYDNFALKWKTSIDAEYLWGYTSNSRTGRYLSYKYWKNTPKYFNTHSEKDKPVDLFKIVDANTGEVVYDGPNANGIVSKYLSK